VDSRRPVSPRIAIAAASGVNRPLNLYLRG
jgi:hypothetical protein